MKRPMSSKHVCPSLVLAFVASLAGCSDSDSTPDARISTPDGAVAVIDARPADARSVDAAPSAADARADAPIPMADAAPPPPDGAPPAPDGQPGPAAAELIINEVAPGITDDMDIVELLVVKAGSTRDIQLWQDLQPPTELLAILPTLAVDSGQIIVVHLQNTDVLTEMSTRDECGDPACYEDAWDVAGDPAANRSIGYSHRVLYLLNANAGFMDAVPFMRRDGVQAPAGFPADLAEISSTGDWKTVCTQPCDYDNIENMHAATVNWTAAGSDALGPTIQRKTAGPDTDTVADWNDAPTTSSLGEPNP